MKGTSDLTLEEENSGGGMQGFGVDVGDTWARSPARTSLMSEISELQRREEFGFGTSSQVNWFPRSRDVSRKGSGEL